jgi:hypothetical protein
MSQLPVALAAILSKVASLPGYVKEAAYLGPEERRRLPNAAFADLGRRYPVSGKAAAYLSAAEYAAAGKPDPALAGRLAKAAAAYGIGDDVRPFLAPPAPPLGPVDHALVLEDGERLFPLDTPGELLKAAADLEAARGKLPYRLRRQAAERMIAKAAEFEVALPRYVRQAAGRVPADPDRLLQGLQARRSITKSANRKRYQELEESLPERINPYLAAEALDRADRLANLHTKYARGVPTPEEICFDGERDEELGVRIGRRLVPVGEIKQSGLDLDDLLPLGDGFVAGVRSSPRAFARTSGIDYAKFAVAAGELGPGDRRRLSAIWRKKAGK